MPRVKTGLIAAEGEQSIPSERHSVTRRRKNANKKALRRTEENAAMLSQNHLAALSNPTYIREQWLCQRGRRHAKELAELRKKRRWVQGQLEDGNIDGGTARELLKLYDKSNVGKAQGPRVEDMSQGAVLVIQHLEYAMENKLGGFGEKTADKSQDPGPVSEVSGGTDSVTVEEEEEWNGFSSDEEE